MKPTQQDIDRFYYHIGHFHVGSRDWMFCNICHICNPLLSRPKPIAYIYTCKKCGKQYLAKGKTKKKKRICKNCK